VPDIQAGLVSTIIPVFNRSSLLEEAVNSVLLQEYQAVEDVIVDDGSTDDTAKIADSLAQATSGSVKVIHKENTGPGPSREVGLQLARGEFIQFLDSDDLLDRKKFADQVPRLKENSEAALCYGITKYYRLGQEGNSKVFAETDHYFEHIFPAFLVRRRWGTSSPVYRRTLLDQVGPWGDMWAEEDWEYDCRIGALDHPILYVNRIGSYQRGLVGQRLSQQGRHDVRTLGSQAESRKRIFYHAKRAGVSSDSPEVEVFTRQLFMLARDCGGAGLYDEARELADMAYDYSNNKRLKRQIAIYRTASQFVGWKFTSGMARAMEFGKCLVRS